LNIGRKRKLYAKLSGLLRHKFLPRKIRIVKIEKGWPKSQLEHDGILYLASHPCHNFSLEGLNDARGGYNLCILDLIDSSVTTASQQETPNPTHLINSGDMAHPSCQLGNSPKKTPTSTPAKTIPAEVKNGEAEAGVPVQKVLPLNQKFGCLRLLRFSSLLLSTHC